jgi:hypothetical protein
LEAGHSLSWLFRPNWTSPSQKALVGSVPATLAINHFNHLTVDSPLAFHASLRDEKSRLKGTLIRQWTLAVTAEHAATKLGAVARYGSCKICHL